ncbi:Receptor-type tyrosine-protein phosphatase epsilon-like [Oopsacas minuta]|uniref:Receptor-type tyrosine-protein phosphatase epsilon-like n=1 Tax=Oopsacas minuta TaxID=111878 RepID=A0AAV7KJ41_9METZ|nr:Receptor-type tyrosine-protein phosphatase epsilon-like [Oopsacas minuta]
MVYAFFVVNTDSIVEISSFDNPSQQVDYILGSTISMLYYSDDIIADSDILWTTDDAEDGDILTYSAEYQNPVLLIVVFNDVGAGIHTVSCFYRMSPVTLLGSVQLSLKDTTTITVSYEEFKRCEKNTQELRKKPDPSDSPSREPRYKPEEPVIQHTPSDEYIDLSAIERPLYNTIDEEMVTYGGYYSNEIYDYNLNENNSEYVDVNNNVDDQTYNAIGNYKRSNSKFIATKNFPATCQLFVESGMGANSLFSVESQNLNKDTNSIAQPDCTEALKRQNVPKTSINNMPFDENRVLLSSPHFDCNYINASYINESKFIAAIHPTKDSYQDFLQMIYQTEASMVVMLTTRKDKAKIVNGYSNYVCYWPKKDTPLNCKPFVSKLIASTETTAFVKQEISLKNSIEGKDHLFTHCISPVWNEDGTVGEISCIIALLIRIMKQSQETPSKPIIIHCDDGIAKTGIVLTTINSVKEMTTEKSINIFNTVKNLRRQRMNMVPTLIGLAPIHSIYYLNTGMGDVGGGDRICMPLQISN